ncbi:hypothetical protein [Streptomyces mayonensis]|uniref:hypothetical protein n=1 Tax=Streptomyces mayonensis TaxID=2750816 RepID=UPI001C1E1FE1|nr:hypothetical protein [Streptomyces sp. A108]MBU6533205.1 hypothetical protein [Streptomyces sp. A108]
MPKKLPASAGERLWRGPSSVGRRAAIGGAVLAVLLAVAGLAAYLTRAESPSAPKAAPRPSSASASASSPKPDSGSAVTEPPRTRDPVTFAKAATRALWSYDTRTYSHAQQLAALKRWMTDEDKVADWRSVAAQVPSPVLWSRMHDNRQHADASIGEGHFPQAFKSALRQDPGAITDAYVYAVTVSGKQSITWKGAGAGAESRSTTLAVQCRPHHDCALVGTLPNTSP